jgi:hypothetical protein
LHPGKDIAGQLCPDDDALGTALFRLPNSEQNGAVFLRYGHINPDNVSPLLVREGPSISPILSAGVARLINMKTKQAATMEEKGDTINLVHLNGMEILGRGVIAGVRSA